MIGKVAVIPFANVDRVKIHINSDRKTMSQIKSDTGADYIINGGYFNMSTFTPVHWLIANGTIYFQPPWKVWGYRLDSGVPALAVSDASYTDFIPSAPLLLMGGLINPNMQIKGLDNSDRGRSAIGVTTDSLVLRCVPDTDGTSDYTFAELASDMLSSGCTSAIGLDGGGSSQCDFNSETVYSARIVHNYILVYLKKEESKVPTVRAYYLPTDGEKQLAPHFKVKEFACNDGELAILIADELPILLEKIRVHFRKPVTITGPYRNPSYNKYVAKGADGSQHKLGTAADIVVSGVSSRTVAKYADTLMPATGGIGLYEYATGGFTHVDVRPTKSRWLQKSASGSAVSVSGF